MRELPPLDNLLLPRDEKPIIVVPLQAWDCLMCRPVPRATYTSVIWSGARSEGTLGRCTHCGQKFVYSDDKEMKLRAGLPSLELEKRSVHCYYCTPDPKPESKADMRWKNDKAACFECGQGYKLPITISLR